MRWGCDLWQSRMLSGFALNEILAIGSAIWQTACGWGSFNYHEVAWLGGCTQNDPVWDACLQVDGDADPTTAPHTPMLPVNLVFGATGAGLYRDRLCTPAGRPGPNTGTRYPHTPNRSLMMRRWVPWMTCSFSDFGSSGTRCPRLSWNVLVTLTPAS